MPTGTLADINHVVLFMQENRAFDHYFGTMAGVRGFADPNVQVNSGNTPLWYQTVNSQMSTATNYLLPWHLNYLGGNWSEATQCMVAGDNGWNDNHAALNNGVNNQWAVNNTAWSWAHFKREDIPVHFGIAEGWTVGDMYQESVIASTNPNRVSWISGSINVPGSPQTPDQGGVYIDNHETPGCEGTNLNCYPLAWKTHPEYLQDKNVTWQVFQDTDNFDDNPLAWFKQFQNAKSGDPLHDRGMQFGGLQQFYDACAAGTLPSVSYIIGPAELSEHPPYQPKDGAWLQKKVVDALVNSKSYNDTALIISYDETGGWGDHVVPFHSPAGTSGEWMNDPYGKLGQVPTGPGFRLPFYIISPWTRGGNVYVENVDHISQIKFVEAWLAAKGVNVSTSQIPAWRRAHMADLTKAFNFKSPDFSLPTIPAAETPSTNSAGSYNGYSNCQAKYATTRPPVPYGKQSANTSLVTEQGFKSVRGQLTEGRYLTLEKSGYALTNGGSGKLTLSKVSTSHNAKSQRFVLHQADPTVNQYTLTSAVDGSYVSTVNQTSTSASKAQNFVIQDLGNGQGYTLKAGNAYWDVVKGSLQTVSAVSGGFGVFSVTYST